MPGPEGLVGVSQVSVRLQTDDGMDPLFCHSVVLVYVPTVCSRSTIVGYSFQVRPSARGG